MPGLSFSVVASCISIVSRSPPRLCWAFQTIKPFRHNRNSIPSNSYSCCRLISVGRALSSLRSFATRQEMESTASMDSKPQMLHILASTVAIMDKAGEIIKNVLKTGELGIVDKGKNDPQTEADRSVQMCIVQSLQKKFPGLAIIAEEDIGDSLEIPSDWIVTNENEDILSKECPSFYDEIKLSEIVCWVDPLDGTREFTTGFLSHVTVLVGFAHNGSPICGVIHQPYWEENGKVCGRTLWALQDVGHGGFELIPPPEDKLIISVTRSRSDEELEAALVRLNPDEIVRVGGAGHKIILILEGRAHAYVSTSRGLKRWDTCAPEAILEYVGGVLTDAFGLHYAYTRETYPRNNNGVVAACNHATLRKLVKALNEDR